MGDHGRRARAGRRWGLRPTRDVLSADFQGPHALDARERVVLERVLRLARGLAAARKPSRWYGAERGGKISPVPVSCELTAAAIARGELLVNWDAFAADWEGTRHAPWALALQPDEVFDGLGLALLEGDGDFWAAALALGWLVENRDAAAALRRHADAMDYADEAMVILRNGGLRAAGLGLFLGAASVCDGISSLVSWLNAAKASFVDGASTFDVDSLREVCQHVGSHEKAGASCWVKGIERSGEAEQRISVRLVRVDAVFFETGQLSPRAGALEPVSCGISAGELQPTGGRWVSPDLVGYLCRYTESRARTAEKLRVLQSRAVVWCKEHAIRDVDSALFRMNSVIVAFGLSRTEAEAFRMLRSDPGRDAVKLGNQLSLGEPLDTTRWTWRGLVTGRDSLTHCAVNTRVLPVPQYHGYGLWGLAWRSVHDLASPRVALPVK